jgi:hydroxyacylglutathione hydrolase
VSERGGSADQIRQFVVGPIQTNCYAYVSDGEAMVVDPGDWGDQIASRLGDVKVVLIAATHGHGDHVGGVAALRRATGAPYAISRADEELATHAGEVNEMGLRYDENAPLADRHLGEGDVLRVGSATFRVMETPGHTPGGVCLVGSHGRTDLEGGDEATILSSLRRMASQIDPDTTLLVGHGESTTMARELRENPFLA